MKKLLILLKVLCRGLLRRRSRINRSGRFGTAGFVLLLLIGWGTIAGYTVALGVGLNSIGMLDVYPVMVLTLESLLTLITAIGQAPGTLFRGQDFDLVMSLPMPGWAVAASRLLELYAFELIYTVVVMLPAGVAYAVLAQPGLAYYPYYFLGLLLAPLLPTLIGSTLGALGHVIGAAFRKSRAVSLALTFVVMLGVMFGSYSIGFYFENFTPAQFIDLANTVSGVFARMYPPSALFGRAVVRLDAVAFLAFAGVSLGTFAVLSWAFGRWFVPLHTWVNARHTRGNFRVSRLRANPVSRALLRRELRRYFSSNIYVLNTAFGLVISLIMAVALQFFSLNRLSLLMELVGYEAQMRMAIPFIVTFMAATCCTTGSSISLEGRQLGLALSLPVSARDYLLAKVRLNLLIALPFALADGLLLAFAFRLTPLAAVLALLLPAVMCAFTALLGLLCNLKWHRFDWTNETVIIKQSLAAGLPVIASVALCLAPLGLTILVSTLDHALVPLLTVVIVALADLGLYHAIARNAEKWVQRLREA